MQDSSPAVVGCAGQPGRPCDLRTCVGVWGLEPQRRGPQRPRTVAVPRGGTGAVRGRLAHPLPGFPPRRSAFFRSGTLGRTFTGSAPGLLRWRVDSRIHKHGRWFRSFPGCCSVRPTSAEEALRRRQSVEFTDDSHTVICDLCATPPWGRSSPRLADVESDTLLVFRGSQPLPTVPVRAPAVHVITRSFLFRLTPAPASAPLAPFGGSSRPCGFACPWGFLCGVLKFPLACNSSIPHVRHYASPRVEMAQTCPDLQCRTCGIVGGMGDRKLYSDEAAEMAGVSFATWRRYCSESEGRRRQAPPHDGTDSERGHVRPWWWESTITAWMANRPGRGAPGVARPNRTERVRRLRGEATT